MEIGTPAHPIAFVRIRLLALVAVLILAFATTLVPAAHAASLVVTNLADSGDGSLRAAIATANATPGADTITFDVSGTITLASQLPAISDPDGLVIDGGNAVTISGNNGVMVLAVNGGAALSIQNLTIADGFSRCGGILNNGTLTVTDSTFTGNRGRSSGGICNSGTLTVSNSTFSANHNSSSNAGGINTWGTATVSNSTFFDNTSVFGASISNGGTLAVTSSTFSGNSSAYGGGIFNSGTVAATNSTFAANSADQGGGIFNSGTVAVSNSTFAANHARYGGAIFKYGPAMVTNSTFSSNSASFDGGGIANWDGTLAVTNSTFSSNSANRDGGGIYNRDRFSNDAATVINSIIANSPSGGNCAGVAVTDGGGNLSYPDTTCPGLNADPQLGPLQDNAGPTETFALLPGSPALDVALANNCPSTDQRGIARPQGSGCDSGAFERVIFQSSGFFTPVDNPPTLNVVKAGRAVPVMFSLSGDQGLNVFAAGSPTSAPADCAAGASSDPVSETDTAGASVLRYDAASDTYTYVWKTNKSWEGCRQLVVQLIDGTAHTALFQFK